MRTNRKVFFALGIIALFALLIGGCLSKQDKVLFTPNDLIITADSDKFMQGDTVQLTVTGGPGPYNWSIEGENSGCTIDQDGLLTSKHTFNNTYIITVKVKNEVNAWGELKMLFENIIINGPGTISQSAGPNQYRYDAVNTQDAVAWAVYPNTTGSILSQDGSATVYLQPGWNPNGDQKDYWMYLICQDSTGNTGVRLLSCIFPYITASAYSVDCESGDTIDLTAHFMHNNTVTGWNYDSSYGSIPPAGGNPVTFTPSGKNGQVVITAKDDLGHISRSVTITLWKILAINPTVNYDGCVGSDFEPIPFFSIVTDDKWMAIGDTEDGYIYRSYMGFDIPAAITNISAVELSLTANSWTTAENPYDYSDLIIDYLGPDALDVLVPGIDDSDFGQPIGGKNPFIYPQFETFDKPVVINHKNWDGLKDHITDCIGGRCDFGMKWETEDWGYGIFLYTTKEATLEYKPTLIIYYY